MSFASYKDKVSSWTVEHQETTRQQRRYVAEAVIVKRRTLGWRSNTPRLECKVYDILPFISLALSRSAAVEREFHCHMTESFWVFCERYSNIWYLFGELCGFDC